MKQEKNVCSIQTELLTEILRRVWTQEVTYPEGIWSCGRKESREGPPAVTDASTSWAAFVFRGWRKLKTLKRHALANSPSQNSPQPNDQIPSRYTELKFVPNGAWHTVSADFFAMYRASTVLQRKRKEYFRILISNISLAISDVYHWTGKHKAKLPLSRNQIRNNSLHLTRFMYLGPVQTTCSNRTFTEFN